jgi:hypothetical protein
MTKYEEQLMYRILFEDSDEEPTSAIYEVYDTLTELISDGNRLKVTQVPQVPIH